MSPKNKQETFDPAPCLITYLKVGNRVLFFHKFLLLFATNCHPQTQSKKRSSAMPSASHDSPSGGSPPPPSKPKGKFLSLILKAIIMMFLISFFFLLLPLASFLLLLPLVLRHQRHRHSRHAHPSPGFSPKQLKKLPQFRFSKETKATYLELDPCVICLDGFKQGQWCRNLVGCGHLFHRKCLDAWLMKVPACPICRARVCLDNDDKCIWGFGSRGTDFQGLLDIIKMRREMIRRLLCWRRFYVCFQVFLDNLRIQWRFGRDQGSSLVASRTKGHAFRILANPNVSSGKGDPGNEVIMVDPLEAKRLAAKQMEQIKAKQKFKRRRQIEAINGAWAMIGLTAGLVIEGHTGKGILAQLAGYLSAIIHVFVG
ncbi:uncharacterized protein LOC111303399 isoform X2 [Durio zibethinus]|uniref:Uncharacterized protein LOC111303399 isoform X2 n=1 Tax=Durio zibethinus TaxID=66656 RepID=A0A6P5ZS56_DURZI|nr:uncharacterized protein LOC111303399 isoform X2 [Durio zibethinus]